MTELTSIDMVKNFIAQNQFSFLYISRSNCSVCHALLPQTKDLLATFPKIQLGYVNADNVEEIAGMLSIFTVPALLLFVEGKEILREARFVHFDQFDEKINKVYSMFD